MARRKGTARVNKAAGEISTKVQAPVKEQAVTAQAASEKAVKEEAVKTEKVVTKTAEDAAEQKTEVKETAQDNAAKDIRKTAVKKTEKAEKKATAKKTEKAEEKQVRLIIQYAGKEFSEEEIIAKAKEAALAQSGLKRLSSIRDIDVYCKPEEHAAYYVANGGKFTGRIEL